MQLGSAIDGVDIVARIFFGRAHIALSIDGVVIFPIRRSGYCDTGFENRAPLAHSHQRVEATKAPSPDADATSVDVRQR